MREILFIPFCLSLVVACNSDDVETKTMSSLPLYSNAGVPHFVETSLRTKYPKASVLHWQEKDSVGYSACFISADDPLPKCAVISYTGDFISETVAENCQ